MKGVSLLFLVLATASAWPSFQNDDRPVSLAQRQLDVLQILYKVNEPIRDSFAGLKDAAKNFNPLADLSHYTDGGEAIKRLLHEVEDHRVLEKHHYFSLFNDRHREEALMLFNALIHCDDWHVGAAVAAYFRERLNEGVFVYGIYVTVIHDDLSDHIVLPPLYEITPHLFTNSEVINQAYSAKMRQTPGKFRMSFTGTQRNPEQRVAYFGEDIGLNVHHVTWHMDYPFWWKDSYGHHLDRKGELFFWVHHQLTVRFDAERLSNHLDFVDELYWDRPIVDGFAPHTTYKYGGEFPSRPDNVRFSDVDGVARIRDLIITENRIRDAIAHGYVAGHDGERIDIRNEHGIDVLGDVIESSEYSPNPEYYGALHNLAHIVLGRQGDPHGKFNMPPGVMEHFETATRDPAFFRLHKYMDNIFKEHKDSLPHYTAEEVQFPGVSVNKVAVKGELKTFFEDFEFDLTMAVDDTQDIEDVPISAIVSRLNHEPFSLTFDVSNSNGGDVFATFRVFLCPRHDANGILFTLNEGRWHCIELDKFWRTLHAGDNHIERKSSEASTTVPDIPSYHTLLEKASNAVESGSDLDLSAHYRSCGIPNRLLLPKGNTEGLDFALVVAVTDGSKDAAIDGLEKDEHGGTHAQCGIHGEVYPDKRPLGFPLDRQIPDERVLLKFPNIHKEVVTVHFDDHHDDH
ncbi:Allergen Cr-PI [Armadillidium nasatum]|uniref:Allergen Cr-PI n=1 Tax=Armadillidium nasatum TaxID=96803 RepID=A0A5N5TE03_9CRUS|nr:Allergen Cr-PI [Armadillidium nasatum]